MIAEYRPRQGSKQFFFEKKKPAAGSGEKRF
jgi:hypothetical protein